jgi:hypothetical protein
VVDIEVGVVSASCSPAGASRECGTLEKAAAMPNHASTRNTQLYDRRRDELSLDEVERIVI